MRALITGGAGFIGSHLAETLLRQSDNEVWVVDDLSTGRLEHIGHLRDHPRFHFVHDSVRNPAVMDHLVRQCEVVFHLAAVVGVQLVVTKPGRVIETNVLGTHVVLEMAKAHQKKVVLASTSEVYGKSTQVPFAEDDDCVFGPTSKERWSYAASKIVDEFMALACHKEEGLPVVVLRLFNTIGPRQSSHYGMVVPRFVRQALRGEPITVYGDGMQSRCFCDVTDAVQAILGLSTHPEAVGRVFNIGGTKEISILQLAELTKSLTNSSSELVFIPYDDVYGPRFDDLRRRVPDTSRIRSLLGWSPTVTLEESLLRIIQFFRAAEGVGELRLPLSGG